LRQLPAKSVEKRRTGAARPSLPFYCSIPVKIRPAEQLMLRNAASPDIHKDSNHG
jgi:hypothetical protein